MIYLSILWHMHQPYYAHPDRGEIEGPTMVFRSLFNYYPMALLLSQFPDIKISFNLTPVLIKQLEGISSGRIRDNFLEILRDETTSREQLALFAKEMPGFALKRFKVAGILNEKIENNTFSSQDLFDMKIYLHLASFHPLITDEGIENLLKKGKGFNMHDQEYLYGKEMDIISKILPLYRVMQDKEQIEISTSPMAHPILPLLFNTDNARKTKTSLSVPEGIFSYPADAVSQLSEGIEVYKKTFAVLPRGIWPSEGSLSNEVLELFSRSSISWTATDEHILSETLGRPLNDEHHRIWDFGGDNKVSVFFRDHTISDLIGFSYQEMAEKEAACSLMKNMEQIGKGSDGRVLTIILDGENPWDFYPEYGQDFLSSLYRMLGDSRNIKSVTFSEAAGEITEHETLKGITPGSWMGNNFDNWIGREPANKAWQILSRAREIAEEPLKSLPEEKKKLLLENIMIAESSDWFWWYSLPANSDIKRRFDSYFRNSIRKIYEISAMEVPAFLSLPVEESGHDEIIPYIKPVIDGKKTHFYEWCNAVEVNPLNLWGTFKPVDFPVEKIFYGYDEENIFIRMDMKGSEDMEIRLIFHNSAEKVLEISGQSEEKGLLSFVKGEITEISIPREGVIAGSDEKKVYFAIKVVKNGQEFKIPSFDYFKINFKEEEYWIV